MAANGEPTPSSRQQHDEETVDRERDFGQDPPSENTPLLQRDEAEQSEESPSQQQLSAASLLRSLRWPGGGKRRWPSLLALLLLCVLAVLIIVFAFIAPSAVEQYASQAVVFEPQSVSVDSFIEDGIRARVIGDITMDSSRVKRKSVRDLGRFCTYIATWAETGPTVLQVSLPEYGNVVLGTAQVPGIKVYIRDGHTTRVDFLTDLVPGDLDGIRRIANDYLDGRLGQLRVVGRAQVPLKSGLISIGKQVVQQEMLFAGDDIPSLPDYDIKKLNFQEVELPNGDRGMIAAVSLKAQNPYPVDLTVPPLRFNVLVDNCEKTEDLIAVADALTEEIHVLPKTGVVVNVTGTVRRLPSVLTQDCPGTTKSPLDNLLGRYIHGKKNTVYVQGSHHPFTDTPSWITALLSDITVPVPVPGRSFGHLIKNFSLTDTHFSLPDPWAEPNTPESNPRISANVRALVAVPEEMNFNISVGRVRADADVYYKNKKLGRLDLHDWQAANSSRVDATPGDGPALMVQSQVKDAPLWIDDDDLFTDVIQDLIFGGKTVVMKIKAEVDVEVETALGDFAIRRIPAEGQVPIKPISSPPPDDPSHPPPDGGLPGNITSRLQPKLVDLRIVNTSEGSLHLAATLNMTNPTKYSATIPYLDVHILKNGSLIAHATARNLSITTGRNAFLEIQAVYDPFTLGGPEAKRVGREVLSQYISGWNTSVTVQLHENSIPGSPGLSRALSRFPVDVPVPRLGPSSPGHHHDDDDDDEHFIKDATMHLFTSTASFILVSPLKHSTLYIDAVNATALYKGQPAGYIYYDLPFDVPPAKETPGGEGQETPRLPVDWEWGSVGYDAIKGALGGRLKLGTRAEVDVRLGRWTERVWFRGEGLGVRIVL